MSLSDRIVVMNKGVIEQIDTPERIYNHPASSYIARFVGETTFFDGALERHGDQLMLHTGATGRIPVEASAGSREGARAVAFVRPEWIALTPPNEAVAQGTVEQIMFFGATKDYLVRFGDALIRVTTGGDVKTFGIGDTAGLRFVARLLP
jgi:ABC-type Fe3+/spermidine/putrescine transport system ATPase subunit